MGRIVKAKHPKKSGQAGDYAESRRIVTPRHDRRIRHMEPARISVYPASCRGRFSADACDARIAPGAVEERKMEPKP